MNIAKFLRTPSLKNIYERLILYLVYSDFLCSLVSSDRRRSLGIQNVRNGTKLTRKFKIIAMENLSGRPIKNVLKTLQKHRIIQQTNKKNKVVL